ncbi:MAG: DUF2066 domain-containing protein [Gammaproteobacteria bacterium]|nr:DUF2066 domain-containing protein [Gammaproteobacteria bacterium]NVK89516.1 DUF2066 domain-containing protein [Gammaproteobacteria bacterium]
MRKVVWVMLLALWSWLPAEAATNDRFRVKVKVEDRSGGAQQQGMIRAFREVIIRASGTKRALEAFYIQESFKKVASFIRTYEYREGELDPQTQSRPLYLIVTFDGNSIRRLLQDSAVPMWSGSIPVSLLWMAHEETGQRQVVNASESEQAAMKSRLIEQANRRGLPVLFPLMDLEDEMLLSVSDVWGRFTDPIIAASERYGSDVIVAGRIINDDGNWQGRYFLKINERQFLQDFSGNEADSVVAEMMDWLAESLCEVYCVTESFTANNQWQLLVQDVGSFYSYRSLLNYLERLSAIRKVEVAASKGRMTMLNVDLVGDIDALRQAIQLDGKLVVVTDESALTTALEYFERKEGVASLPEPAATPAPVENAQPVATQEGNGLPMQPLPLVEQPAPRNILLVKWRP